MHAYNVLGPLEEKIIYLATVALVIMKRKNTFLSELLSQCLCCYLYDQKPAASCTQTTVRVSYTL